MEKHIINCLVENQPGVLARIVGLIAGRGYNIDTLNVGPTSDPSVSKMTMVVLGDEHVIHQVALQLGKQVNVISVTDMTRRSHIDRELVLVRIAVRDHSHRVEVLDLASLFHASIVSVQEGSVTVQMVGDQATVSDFLKLLKAERIIDLSRTGVIAVGRDE